MLQRPISIETFGRTFTKKEASLKEHLHNPLNLLVNRVYDESSRSPNGEVSTQVVFTGYDKGG
jgi:hypothetical protein